MKKIVRGHSKKEDEMSESKQAKNLLRKKEIIEENKSLKSRLEGQLDQLESRLLSDFGCKDEKEIDKRLDQIGISIDDMDEELTKQIEQLEKEFDWE